ncbi:MAG: Hint domain-containing protein [Alphaproteobacteria bacterium]|nr:Hint domain-containing protein [Alphaproteobacteria bacterium]
MLQIDNTVTSTGVTFDFLSAVSGELGLTDDSGFSAGNTDTISGLDVGTGGLKTNFIDLEGAPGVRVTHISYGPGNASGVVTLSDGAVLNLANIAGANNAQPWFVNWGSDGAVGTDLYLNSVACFCAGTRILTDRGEVAVEELSIGDLAITQSAEAKPIKWIGRRSYPGGVIADRKVLPIRVAAGALGAGLPFRDLYLSPEHALYIEGVLVPAGELVNGRSIVQMESISRLEYFHIELEDHGVIYADGAAAETFVDCDNRGMFDNGNEFAALYPREKRPTWNFCAQRAERGSDAVNAIRLAFLQRAEELGYELTEEPDLHLVVDGQVVRAETASKNRHKFMIPAGAQSIWLASRTAVPAEVIATSKDRRRLGVCITQLCLSDEHVSFEVDSSYPDLCEGFHAAERGHRWTSGRARCRRGFSSLLSATSCWKCGSTFRP